MHCPSVEERKFLSFPTWIVHFQVCCVGVESMFASGRGRLLLRGADGLISITRHGLAPSRVLNDARPWNFSDK
jgi:hypothetical protein